MTAIGRGRYMDMQKSPPPYLGSGGAAAMALRAACSGIANSRNHTLMAALSSLFEGTENLVYGVDIRIEDLLF